MMKRRLLAALLAAMFALALAAPLTSAIPEKTVRFNTPYGYNENDYQKMVEFLEYEDNRVYCYFLGLSYDPYDPESWGCYVYDSTWDKYYPKGVIWSDDMQDRRITHVSFACEMWPDPVCGSLDVSDFEALEYVSIYQTGIVSLNCSGCSELTFLNAYENPLLEELIVDGCSKLDQLTCDRNAISELDVSDCSALKTLTVSENNIAELDVSCCSGLEMLNCGANELSALDVTNCACLYDLVCRENNITKLDLSNNSMLSFLRCGSNRLTALDVSACPGLYYLFCENNAIAELDLSNNPYLEALRCENNVLTNLDVSANRELAFLWCFGNRLKTIDLTNNPRIIYDMISADGDGCVGYTWGEDEGDFVGPVAEPMPGASFEGWYTEDGAFLSDNPELSDNGGKKRVVARFGKADYHLAGDADGSGIVNASDALMILRAALGLIELPEEALAVSDVDHNGTITAGDALLVLRYALGLIDSL